MEIINYLVNNPLILYSVVVGLFVWNIVLSVIVYVKHRRYIGLFELNNLEHMTLMKNQKTIFSTFHKIESKLRDEGETLKSIKTIVIQKILPSMQKDNITRTLQANLEKAERKNEENKSLISDLTQQISEQTAKYEREIEKLKIKATTLPLKML